MEIRRRGPTLLPRFGLAIALVSAACGASAPLAGSIPARGPAYTTALPSMGSDSASPAAPTGVSPPLTAPTSLVVNSSAPQPPVGIGHNLLTNGGGDGYGNGNLCSLAGWTTPADVQAALYGSRTGEPGATTPGPADRGACYLRGAIGAGASEEPSTQQIDLSTLASAIDSETLKATVTGWFGGGPDAVFAYNATFNDASGEFIDVLIGGEVSLPTDPAAMAQSTATMDVPAGTRSVVIDLTLIYDGDCTTCAAEAYADSLSLVLGGG